MSGSASGKGNLFAEVGVSILAAPGLAIPSVVELLLSLVERLAHVAYSVDGVV